MGSLPRQFWVSCYQPQVQFCGSRPGDLRVAPVFPDGFAPPGVSVRSPGPRPAHDAEATATTSVSLKVPAWGLRIGRSLQVQSREPQ